MTSSATRFNPLPNFLRHLFFFSLILMAALAGPVTARAMDVKVVEVTTADNFVLSGILATGATSNHAGVVLLHMYRQGKESWEPLLAELTARGFTCLALDLRGHGGSRYSPAGEDLYPRVAARDPLLFRDMTQDGEAGVRYLIAAGIPKERIGLVGASVGSSIAIATVTGGQVPVRAAVVMSPGADYLGIPTLQQIKKWKNTPLLILSSVEEASLGANDIYFALRERGAELQTFAQDEIHGTYMFGKVPGVEKLIGDWLVAKLSAD